ATAYWSQALKNFIRLRDRLPASRTCDLRYDAIRRDPIAAARRVYEYFDWRLTDDAEERMRAVLFQQSTAPRGGGGLHRYNASQFKLNNMNGFAEYCERFGFRQRAAD